MAYPNLGAELSRVGITQIQVAKLLGKNQSTISSWMHGKKPGFSVAQAQMVRDAFFPNMSIDYLFNDTPMPTENATL